LSASHAAVRIIFGRKDQQRKHKRSPASAGAAPALSTRRG
jgi:hypothetical protein